MPNDTFEFNTIVTSGSLAGNALWSNLGNWSTGLVPVDGETVTTPAFGIETDDINGLSLSSMGQPLGSQILVTGNLTIGSFMPGSAPILDAIGPAVTLAILADDTSGASYLAEAGTVIFAGSLAASTSLGLLMGAPLYCKILARLSLLKLPSGKMLPVISMAPT